MLQRLFSRKYQITKKPWIGLSSTGPYGMLGPEERQCLSWLARHNFSGEGAIIDAGAFIGASAYALASGLKTNSRSGRPIHSYDYFSAIDDYVIEHISQNVRPIQRGESYLDLFRSSIERYQDKIEIHPGDFLEYRWDATPIEILFIDVAKTRELNEHLLREFFIHLIPKWSIVVQQDFYHCWHPYIHATMEALSDFFEIVDPRVLWSSRVYRLKKALSAEDVESAITLVSAETAQLLEQAAKKETGDMQAMIEVARLWHILSSGDVARYDREAEHFRKSRSPTKELWSTQFQLIERNREKRRT